MYCISICCIVSIQLNIFSFSSESLIILFLGGPGKLKSILAGGSSRISPHESGRVHAWLGGGESSTCQDMEEPVLVLKEKRELCNAERFYILLLGGISLLPSLSPSMSLHVVSI